MGEKEKQIMNTATNLAFRAIFVSTIVLVVAAWVFAVGSANLNVTNTGFAAEIVLIFAAVLVGIGATCAMNALLPKPEISLKVALTDDTTIGYWICCVLIDFAAVTILLVVTIVAVGVKHI